MITSESGSCLRAGTEFLGAGQGVVVSEVLGGRSGCVLAPQSDSFFLVDILWSHEDLFEGISYFSESHHTHGSVGAAQLQGMERRAIIPNLQPAVLGCPPPPRLLLATASQVCFEEHPSQLDCVVGLSTKVPHPFLATGCSRDLSRTNQTLFLEFESRMETHRNEDSWGSL